MKGHPHQAGLLADPDGMPSAPGEWGTWGRPPLYQLTRPNRTMWQSSTCCIGDGGSRVKMWWHRGASAEASEHHVWEAQLSVEGLMMLIDRNPEWSLINVICWQLVIINGNVNSIIPQGDNY